LVIGSSVLAAWALHASSFTSVVPGWATQKPNTALCFILFGVALRAGARAPALATVFGTAVTGIAAMTAVEIGAGLDLHIDEWLFVDTLSRVTGRPPGQMSAASAAGLMCNGIGLVMAATGRDRTAMWWAVAGAVPGAVALFAYSVTLEPLPNALGFGTVSVPTALGLVAAAVGVASFSPTVGVVTLFDLRRPSGTLVRRVAPLVFLPSATSFIVIQLGVPDPLRLGAVVTISSAGLAAAVLWASVGLDGADRARTDLVSSLRQRDEALVKLSRHLVDAREAERAHVARELHDVVGQDLTLLAHTLDALPTGPHQSDARALVGSVSDTVRGLVRELQPPLLDTEGLTAAVRSMAIRWQAATKVRVDVTAAVPERRTTPAAELAAFRIAQEALTNTRHGRASEVRICIEWGADSLTLTVEDNGQGLPAAFAPGVGWIGMHERARAVGGDLSVHRHQGATVVRACLPAPVRR
jgi:signal transduction histidine kinase